MLFLQSILRKTMSQLTSTLAIMFNNSKKTQTLFLRGFYTVLLTLRDFNIYILPVF